MRFSYIYSQLIMIELPVIGSSCLGSDFWDRHGANIATPLKEMYGKT